MYVWRAALIHSGDWNRDIQSSQAKLDRNTTHPRRSRPHMASYRYAACREPSSARVFRIAPHCCCCGFRGCPVFGGGDTCAAASCSKPGKLTADWDLANASRSINIDGTRTRS